MRLLVRSKIWRAFPELDRFDEDQCARFVAAARGSWQRRLLLSARVLAFGVALTLGIVVLELWIFHEFIDGPRRIVAPDSIWNAVIALGVMLPLLCLGPAGGYIFRDWLLRRRVRFVIHSRGSCNACGYILLGLRVNDDTTVICPECGLRSEVDPALGELAKDASGQTVLSPMDRSKLPRLGPRFWTPRRVRVVSYGGLIAVALGVFGYIGWHIFENIRIDRQAARAKSMWQGAAPFVTLQHKVLPPASEQDGVDGWQRFDAVMDAIRIVDMKVWDNENRPMVGGSSVSPDYTMVLQPVDGSDRETGERLLATAKLAERMIEALRTEGVLKKMADLANFRRALWTPDMQPEDSPIDILLPQLGRARNLARVNKARMVLAIKADDPAEFASALDVVLALSRLTSLHPTLISQLVSIAIDALGCGCIREAIAAHPTTPWLDAIEASLARGSRVPPREYAMRGEQVWMRETIIWYFSDVQRVQHGPRGAAWSLDRAPGRLGTLEENLDAVDAAFDGYARLLASPRMQRDPALLKAVDDTRGLSLLSVLLPAVGKTIASFDQIEIDQRGISTMIALERFRIRTGAYPKVLAELVPIDLPALPLDTYSGRPLCFRLQDAAADPEHRGYLLYSTGADGIDNGGRSPAEPFTALSTQAGSGTDFILNRSR